TSAPVTTSSAPPSGLRRLTTRLVNASASPSTLSISPKRAARAAAMVASPSAITGTLRRRLAAANARTPLGLVKTTAWTPGRDRSRAAAEPGSSEVVSNGSNRTSWPCVRNAAESSVASAAGRVMSTLMPGLLFPDGDSRGRDRCTALVRESQGLICGHWDRSRVGDKKGPWRFINCFLALMEERFVTGSSLQALTCIKLRSFGIKDRARQPGIARGSCRSTAREHFGSRRDVYWRHREAPL